MSCTSIKPVLMVCPVIFSFFFICLSPCLMCTLMLIKNIIFDWNVIQSYLLIIRDNQTCWWICWNRRQRAGRTGSHREQLCLRRPNQARVTRSARREFWWGARLFRHGSGVKRQCQFRPNRFFSAIFSLNKCRSWSFLGVNKQTNTAGIRLFLIFGTQCHLCVSCVYFRNGDESAMEQYSPASHPLYVPHHFYSMLRFILPILIFCVIYLETAKSQAWILLDLRFYLW